MRRDPLDTRDYLYSSYKSTDDTIMGGVLPSKVDQTNGMSSVKFQGKLGSCIAFSAVAAKEWQERKEHLEEVKEGKVDHRKNKIEYNLSEQWLYYMCKKIDGRPNGYGTNYRSAMKVLQKIGVPVEHAWPYNDTIKGTPKKWAHLIARWAMIGSYYKTYGLEEMKTALVEGPVLTGFPVFPEMLGKIKNGIIEYPVDPDKNYGAHAVCLSGDTKIPLLNGETKTIKELSEKYSDETFEVYSCTDEGKIVKGVGHSPRKTDTNRTLLKILLDNGKYLKCTKEHLIMKRDGSYVKAKDLKINNSLMPLYREIDRYGYEKLWDNYSKKWIRTHQMVSSPPNKMIVHHKNFNKRDNCSNNLQIMTWDEHTTLHSQNILLLKKYARSKAGREKSRETMKKNWRNKEFRKKMTKVNSNNGYKVSKKLLDKGILGFQNMSTERLKELGHINGVKNCHNLHKKEIQAKSLQTRREKMLTDKDFRNKKIEIAVQNLSKYNDGLKNGEKQLTQKQLEARKNNMKNINNNKELTKMRGLKTAYTRFHQNKYETFEEYLKVNLHNHKIISIEICKDEDVYDIIVDKYHNFAIETGIFVHNCAVGYDDSTQLVKIKNSWSKFWGQAGYAYLSYDFVKDFMTQGWVCRDISVTTEMMEGARNLLD